MDVVSKLEESEEVRMEKQIVTITIVTEGENCEMSNQQIVDWYQENIASLFNPQYGTPKISVTLERKELV